MNQAKKTEVVVVNGNKLFPGLGDRHLAKTGYRSQQYDGAPDPDRKNNLWEAVPGDFGARGRLDDRSVQTSWQLRLNMHRAAAALFSFLRR